jgi:hypothetical protein
VNKQGQSGHTVIESELLIVTKQVERHAKWIKDTLMRLLRD